MKKPKEDYSTRTIKTPDGLKITFFDNKFHNWDGPAIRYPSYMKQKPEYYLYGFKKTRDEWMELRKDRNGVPPDKNPQVQSRF